jgi:hypothetical protein
MAVCCRSTAVAGRRGTSLKPLVGTELERGQTDLGAVVLRHRAKARKAAADRAVARCASVGSLLALDLLEDDHPVLINRTPAEDAPNVRPSEWYGEQPTRNRKAKRRVFHGAVSKA